VNSRRGPLYSTAGQIGRALLLDTDRGEHCVGPRGEDGRSPTQTLLAAQILARNTAGEACADVHEGMIRPRSDIRAGWISAAPDQTSWTLHDFNDRPVNCRRVMRSFCPLLPRLGLSSPTCARPSTGCFTARTCTGEARIRCATRIRGYSCRRRPDHLRGAATPSPMPRSPCAWTRVRLFLNRDPRRPWIPSCSPDGLRDA
jgi:hypothetical protein